MSESKNDNAGGNFIILKKYVLKKSLDTLVKYNLWRRLKPNVATYIFVFSSIFLDTLITLITDKSLGQLIDFELRILFGLSLLIGSFAFLWDGVLLGLDKSREFSSLTVVSSIIGFISCSYFLNFENTLSSLWIGLNLSLVYRGVAGFLYQIRD